MTNGPNVWNVGDAIPFEIFIVHPDTNQGLEGVTDITFSIQRDSDSRYWDGSAWSITETNLSLTEIGSGRYTYILSASGNASADRYVIHAVVTDLANDIDAAENFEIHVSRVLDTRIYELEPA